MAKVRVLVADDNKGMRNMLTSMLAAEFDVIRAVSDGCAALTATTQMLPDVAILGKRPRWTVLLSVHESVKWTLRQRWD
jgi:CheY-like chemotaxis protein